MAERTKTLKTPLAISESDIFNIWFDELPVVPVWKRAFTPTSVISSVSGLQPDPSILPSAKTPFATLIEKHMSYCVQSVVAGNNQQCIVFECNEVKRCFCLMMPKPLVVEQGQRREGRGVKACFQMNTAITPLKLSSRWEIRHQQVFFLFCSKTLNLKYQFLLFNSFFSFLFSLFISPRRSFFPFFIEKDPNYRVFKVI